MERFERSTMADSSQPPAVSLAEALPVWLRVASLSFGGPAGQIAVMHRILVEEKRWIGEERFLHALNYCMLLPGPEAQQLATYIGWLLHGVRGGLVAGLLFIAPGFFAIMALSIVYALYASAPVVVALFFGLKAAVLAIVVEAVVRIGRRALRNRAMVVLAAVAFVAIFFFAVPFPLIIVAAALIGLLLGRWQPALFAGAANAAGDTGARSHTRPRRGWSLRVVLVCASLWSAPIALLAWTLGGTHVLVNEALFFSKAAVVTFGGAYAVLAYIGQQAVDVYGWLQPGEMLDGLGLAETTPGPLIIVVQFVGFLGAYRNPAPFDPLLAGVLGAVVTVWVTFVPCFLWIFLGAPYIEQLRGNRALTAALSAITAAVVGVVLNLAAWFGLHVAFATVNETNLFGMRLFVPLLSSANWASICLAAAAFVMVFRLRWGMAATLAACSVMGAAVQLVVP